MTIPLEYQRATAEFDRFLADVLETTGLATRNQAYTVVQGVLLAFRSRLDLHDAIRFASVLPPVLRAIFVADWDPDEARRSWGDLEALTADVKALRRDHNFAPDSAIRDVAEALRRNVDPHRFERTLAALPSEAAAFWEA